MEGSTHEATDTNYKYFVQSFPHFCVHKFGFVVLLLGSASVTYFILLGTNSSQTH